MLSDRQSHYMLPRNRSTVDTQTTGFGFGGGFDLLQIPQRDLQQEPLSTMNSEVFLLNQLFDNNLQSRLSQGRADSLST